jgi:hypothetical protein
MADTAFQKQYRQEFIAGFEDRQSVLRSTCTTEAVIKGNEAVFLIATSGSTPATAVTRGINGLIPARNDDLTQITCTLAEWHDLTRKTDFNIFASQGDQKAIMQMMTMGVMNRKIDDLIIAQLDTATNDTGTAETANLDLVIKTQVILGNNFVDLTDEDGLFFLITPAFNGYMMQVPEYASADYVEVKPFSGPAKRFRRWMGFNWIVHPRLTGSVGAGSTGANELCYAFHRSAIGHCADTSGMDSRVGYDEEQAYSFVRTSMHMGAKLLQNAGVVQVKHNGSAYAAS